MVDSLRYLQNVGEQVQQTFLRNKTILSFQEYMDVYFERPRVHARDAAQYIRDCFDFYGSETVQRSSGPVRRFKLFDRPFDQGANSSQEGEGGAPICGQEEGQNAIYRILSGFVRAGRMNKLILLHGPNGSAKTSIVAAIQRALEDYSRKEEGQLYRFNWIFPSEKLVKGSIGFGETKNGGPRGERHAHLQGAQGDARIHCELTYDRSHGALPGALQTLALSEPYGPLVAGNRGVIEFSDLLKRPLEHYKYLLGTVETGVARMSHFLLHLDCALIASTNEKHLSAFKEMSDFASLKGRIELVRVPYLRTVSEERQVYEFRLQETVGKHIAPHPSWGAGEWAVPPRP